MSIATSTATASLAEVMTNLVAVEGAVHDDLRVYRYRPPNPDLPCLWNWIPAAGFEQRDQARWRDNVTILAQIGIRHSDVNEEMAKLEEYADAFRFTIDPALHARRPLGAVWARRTDMRTTEVNFGAFSALVVEFPILVQLDRIINPS